MKLTFPPDDSNSLSYQLFHQFANVFVSVSDAILSKALQQASQSYSGHQTRQDRHARRFLYPALNKYL